MNAMIIPQAEFEKLIKIIDDIHKVVDKLRPNHTFIDNSDFVRMMNISKRTAQTWRLEKRIAYSQVGAKIYYASVDIDKLIRNNLILEMNSTPTPTFPSKINRPSPSTSIIGTKSETLQNSNEEPLNLKSPKTKSPKSKSKFKI
jgi:hypothetical protein